MGWGRWKQTETKRNIYKPVINWTKLEKNGEIGKKRDGKGIRTGRELDGTGRGRIRYGDVNRRERDGNGT